MQHVTLIVVGSLKEAGFSACCNEYIKRLGAYCKPEVIEVAESKLPKNPSPAQIDQCVTSEGLKILDRLPPRSFVAAMCIEGKQFSSENFSAQLERLKDTHSHITFVIGGSHGLSQEVKQAAGLCLSMSTMTFPHQLARVMLLEQIYRAFSISAGSKYHK